MSKSASFIGAGLAMGAGIGAAIGNVALGIGLGIAFGAIIGAVKTDRNPTTQNPNRDNDDSTE